MRVDMVGLQTMESHDSTTPEAFGEALGVCILGPFQNLHLL